AHPSGNQQYPATLVVITLQQPSSYYAKATDPNPDPNPGLRGQPKPGLGNDGSNLVTIEVFSGTAAEIDAETPTKPKGQWPAQPVGSPAWVYNDTVAWVEGNNTAGRWTIGLR